MSAKEKSAIDSGGRKFLLRNFNATDYLELFLVSAVSAVLVIRLFLHLSGYPRLGGDRLHIAHMLWGGLFMLAGIIILLSFLGRGTRRTGAFLGGIGFGTFIDEIGKFVTKDNDYFFQPAVSLIYITFILIYLAVRMIHWPRPAGAEENMVNALQEIKEGIISGMDPERRRRILEYVGRAREREQLAGALGELVQRVREIPAPSDPYLLERLKHRVFGWYRRLTRWPRFARLLIVFFLIQLGIKVINIATLIIWPDWHISLDPALPRVDRIVAGITFAEWAQLASAALSGVFVALGIFYLRSRRLLAFQMFRHSILVSIFITQVFVFYRDEWSALTMLVFNLLVLAALHFIIDHESESSRSGE